MEIFITNDDGYQAKGIKILTETMRQFGSVTVIAPKYHQSGMSMAVSLGLKQIAYKELLHEDEVRDSSGNLVKGALRTAYLDATPASCIKFGLNTCFLDKFPDVVVAGINHGSNAASASCYSGTLGAALEGALKLKERILADLPVKRVDVIPCRGLTSFYAMEKGLIVGY